MRSIELEQITGLVLAGGQGLRMGGLDKGLQLWHGVPLAQHAYSRLKPQVGPIAINANRHLNTYETLGVPVWPDTEESSGPLSGILAGLTHCTTPYLITVPCDAPYFPHDLVERLFSALQTQKTDIAIAATQNGAQRQSHPVFCLMKTQIINSLQEFLATGQRKVFCWINSHSHTQVLFDDSECFTNINTLNELSQARKI
jgi:molybdenum cofactor guanylyltransferase